MPICQYADGSPLYVYVTPCVYSQLTTTLYVYMYHYPYVPCLPMCFRVCAASPRLGACDVSPCFMIAFLISFSNEVCLSSAECAILAPCLVSVLAYILW